MDITTEQIKEWVGNETTYQRGMDYFLMNRVSIVEVNEEKDTTEIRAIVRGKENYQVEVILDDDGPSSCYCDCPAFQNSYHDTCKHIAATLLAYVHKKKSTLQPFPEKIGFFSMASQKIPGTEPASLPHTKKPASGKKRVTDLAIYELMKQSLDPDLRQLHPQEAHGEIRLEMQLHLQKNLAPVVGLKIGNKKMYVVSSVQQFLSAVQRGEELHYGKNLHFVHTLDHFDPRSRELIRILTREADDQALQRATDNAHRPWQNNWYYRVDENPLVKVLQISPGTLDQLIALYEGSFVQVQIHLGTGYKKKGTDYVCCVQNTFPQVPLFIQKNENGHFDFGTTEATPPVGAYGQENYYWHRGDTLYRCEKNAFAKLDKILCALYRTPHHRLTIDRRDLRSFFALNLQEVEPYIQLDMDPADKEAYEPWPLDSGIYLDVDEQGDVEAKVTFLYGEHQVNPMETTDEKGIRNLKQEIPVMKVVNRYLPTFNQEKQLFQVHGDEGALALLERGIQELEEVSVVYATDAFRRILIQKPVRPSVRVSISRGILDVEISLDGFSLDELISVLEEYKAGKKYARLRSGGFLKLEKAEMEELKQLTEDLDLEDRPKGKKFSDTEELHRLELPLPRALFIRESLRQCKHASLTEAPNFKDMVDTIASARNNRLPIPGRLEDVLRPYQKEGVQWLHALSQCHMGGILADDMGLGKTLQVLALLLSYYASPQAQEDPSSLAASEPRMISTEANLLKIPSTPQPRVLADAADLQIFQQRPQIQPSSLDESMLPVPGGRKPSLVVCPTSLVLNWEQEIQKFAPELTTLLITGKATDRQDKIRQIPQYQVIITSYDTLRRDAALYEGCHFAFHILDEAQYIKNQFTKNARSVKEIASDYRFALTGTPMENYICELWSIFDFLMPGYLYSHRKFQEKFENPIEKQKDDKALEKLRKLVSPFLLRRMKKEVLQELPEKMESTRYLEMDEEQSKIYKSNAALLHKQLREQLEDQGLAKSKILVLSMITKLRQICCHPGLCFDNYHGSSVKLDAAMELIQTGIDNQHKLLVFSQFTSMLALVEAQLKKQGMRYYLLTGSTPPPKRSQMVNDFNKDDTPVFLISLKAGGTGLNLTGADIVLHLDPWWNISAQNQATDRAHRIGQTSKVQVYKLIAKDTIEEKIQRLQEHKANLAEALLEGEGQSFTDMNAEDILALFRE